MQDIYHQIMEVAKSASKTVITAHKSPDGDSIGSSLAMKRFLQNVGLKNVEICHPDPVSEYLKPFLRNDKVVDFKNQADLVSKSLNEADVIFVLDYNEPSRLGDLMSEELVKSKAKKIMIDHHLHPADFVDLKISETSSCSTAQLIYDLIEKSGNIQFLDEPCAEAIYLGILTDSGSFRFPSVQARTHEAVARLLNTGLLHHRIHEEIHDNNTVDRLKLRAHIINSNLKIYPDHNTAVVYVTDEEKNRFNYQDGDTEGIVNVALSIKGIEKAAFFNETEDKIKISFRSKGVENPINMLANKYFSGGGHANAAGGVSNLSLKDTIEKFVSILGEF